MEMILYAQKAKTEIRTIIITAYTTRFALPFFFFEAVSSIQISSVRLISAQWTQESDLFRVTVELVRSFKIERQLS